MFLRGQPERHSLRFSAGKRSDAGGPAAIESGPN
jgi:hypothetical protein